jgi:hypothetical protein
MDPFIESQLWQGFSSTFIVVLGELLVAQVRPRYVVRVEEYVYLSLEGSEEYERTIEPDLALMESPEPPLRRSPGRGTVATIVPAKHTVSMSRRHRQKYLTIRNRASLEVVTVVELLSPWNKVPADGRSEYLVKRNNIFNAHTHLVEIDLLRGGQRLPTREPLEKADFYAFVCRAQELPEVEVYAWQLREKMPVLPIPLAGADNDAPLDLQQALTTNYDRQGYDYAIDYTQPIEPKLDDGSLDWVRSVLAK